MDEGIFTSQDALYSGHKTVRSWVGIEHFLNHDSLEGSTVGVGGPTVFQAADIRVNHRSGI